MWARVLSVPPTSTTRCLVLIATVAAFLLPISVADAAPCTPLADKTPVANEVITILSNECPGDITLNVNGVSIIFEPGAGYFQAGKSIHLPTGTISDFRVDIQGVNWLTAQVSGNPMFQGSSTVFQDSTFLIKNASITSSTQDPVGFHASGATLGPRSTYTVEGSSIDVTFNTGSAYSLGFGKIDGGTLIVKKSTVTIGTTGSTRWTSGIGLRVGGPMIGASVTVVDTPI